MCIVTAAVLLFAAVTVAAAEVAKMTREEALRYLDGERYAVDQSNLVSAIMNGNPELAEALLSAGVDVNDPQLIKPALRLAASSRRTDRAPAREGGRGHEVPYLGRLHAARHGLHCRQPQRRRGADR